MVKSERRRRKGVVKKERGRLERRARGKGEVEQDR